MPTGNSYNNDSSGGSRNSSSTLVGVLLVIFSVLCWLIIDTIVAMVPPSGFEVKQGNERFFSRKNNSLTSKRMGKEVSHIWWLVQISDIHISAYHNFHISGNLEYFLSDVIPAINPLTVVATGDLTDAKKSNMLVSTQELAEWQTYQRIVTNFMNGTYLKEKYHTFNPSKVVWIDMRGNHDKFDVVDHDNDFYRYFTILQNIPLASAQLRTSYFVFQ